MTFRDVMQFRSIHTPVISSHGHVVAYEVRPDRGDGEVLVHDLRGDKKIKIARGRAPVISTTKESSGIPALFQRTPIPSSTSFNRSSRSEKSSSTLLSQIARIWKKTSSG